MWAAAALLLLAADPPAAGSQPIPLDQARRVFDEVRLASEEDGGRLWRVPLYGPMLFVDPQSRTVVANRPDSEHALRPAKDGLFVGTLPPTVAVANTAIEWSGVKWTMILWDSISDRTVPRRRLLLHESFHRIQNEIGLPMAPADNSHLDSLEGRYWLLLEMRALATALRGDHRDVAIADAAAFRARRRSLFPAASAGERALENNEGLAEYTGFALRGTSDEETRLAVARWRLDDATDNGTLVRSFAYATGPAWGLLLDEVRPEWRAGFHADSDLASVAIAAAKVTLPADVETRATQYDGPALRVSEETRAREQARRVAEYRARLVEGPLLLIPTAIASFGFDPNAVVPVGKDGTVHPRLQVTGDWGQITSDAGVRVTVDSAYVAFAAEDRARLKLTAGWELRPGPRPGDLVVTRVEAK